ncbi:invasion protein IagB, partial [Salmonella enterica subsp. enterica serovar Worthington str. BCH-3194]
CFAAAGARYQIEPLLLKAISAGESSLKPGAININKDRKTGKASSTDYGLMQINSTHIPKLIKMGVIKKSEDLITKPCLNIHIGSWILARHF